jgi:nicotinamidase-related amidase
VKTFNNTVIYENLGEIIDPVHTALVVWDVQQALFSRIFNQTEFLKHLQAIIEGARRARIPVIYTRVVPPPPQFESSWRMYLQMKRFGISDPAKLPLWIDPGSPGAVIPPAVSPLAGDLVIDKYTASLFTGTPVEYLLHNRGIQTLIFTGLLAEAGVESSARESANRGFYTIVAEDCVSSVEQDTYETTLQLLKKLFLVIVEPSANILSEWPHL